MIVDRFHCKFILFKNTSHYPEKRSLPTSLPSPSHQIALFLPLIFGTSSFLNPRGVRVSMLTFALERKAEGGSWAQVLA